MQRALATAVAATIRHFRRVNQVSEEALAARSGLDRTYISGVERAVRNITLDSLESIVEALEVDWSVFLQAVADNISTQARAD
jgi:transcriptional regulator with XRE-family HTH domain